ncbi:FUSC family protein, partial [Demequina sp.]|uniref:FUSC family protein n=1 Tax=Demequina sp. TaxID=2050685 RepID=UPI0025D4ED3C
SPALLGLIVAASVMAAAPHVLKLGPVVGAAPVAVAAAGTDAAAAGPVALGVGAAVGALAVTVVLRALLKVRVPPTPLAPRLAWTYLIALAAGAGLAIAVARAFDVAHSLWIVVALSAVLVPAARETQRHAVARVVGTLVGALLATVVASVLPGWALVVVAVIGLVFGIGWALAQSQSAGSAWTAGAIVLIAGAIEANAAWDAALQRAGLTVIGGAIAAVLALAIARAETAEEGEAP